MELEFAMMGTPASQLVDLMSTGVHKASESAPPSSGATSPSVEGQWAPFPLSSAPKRAHHAPTTTMLVSPKEEEVTMHEGPLPMGPSNAITDPSERSQLWWHCRGTSHLLLYHSHFLPYP